MQPQTELANAEGAASANSAGGSARGSNERDLIETFNLRQVGEGLAKNSYAAGSSAGQTIEVETDRQRREPYEDPMVDKDYVDAKAEATRAQNDARFSQVMSRLETLSMKLETATLHMPTTSSMFGTAAASVIAIIGLGVAILAFGGDRFDGGMGAASITMDQAISARETANRNAERLDDVDKKLDVLIDLMRVDRGRENPS